MPHGINYKRIKKDLAFVSSQARKGCSLLCFMYLEKTQAGRPCYFGDGQDARGNAK